ncbi:pleckstrin homology domain-containing family M member 1 [Tachysurus ichikawai]
MHTTLYPKHAAKPLALSPLIYNDLSSAPFTQIADNQYESFLQSVVQFSCNHVQHCDLCTQRGFICQICNADDIIFPFQFDTTSRCKACKSVFHSSCKTQSVDCPRCERLQRYKERDHLE